MCCNFTKVKVTKIGILIYVNHCKKFQLSFNNLHLSLDIIGFETFKISYEKQILVIGKANMKTPFTIRKFQFLLCRKILSF
jgi:hypothetical protein